MISENGGLLKTRRNHQQSGHLERLPNHASVPEGKLLNLIGVTPSEIKLHSDYNISRWFKQSLESDLLAG